MFDSIFIFLGVLIPVPLSTIHHTVLLSSFKISAFTFFTFMFLEVIEPLLKIILNYLLQY